MGLESTKSRALKAMEAQLQELQRSLSEEVAAFRDTSIEAARERYRDAANTLSFGEIYMPHYFTDEGAAFHEDLDRMVHSPERHVYIVHGPREHAKSTVVRAGFIRRLLFGERHYAFAISEELKLARGHVAYIAAEFQSNRRIQSDFDVEIQRYSENEGVLQMAITPRATGTRSLCRLEAASYKTGVKGALFMQHRPDMAMIDDFEDTESSRNEVIAARKVTWVFQELYPACSDGDDDAPGAPIIWLGNTGHKTSALYQAMLECVEDTTDLPDPESALADFLRVGTDPRGGTIIPEPPDHAVESARYTSETGSWVGSDPSDTRMEAPTSASGSEASVTAAKSMYSYRASTELQDRTVYLWPERYKATWYLRMKMTMGPSRYESEMNGNPQLIGVFFEAEWFPTYDDLPEDIRMFSWCDPAFGTSKSSAFKAVVVIATDRHRYYVVDAWVRQTEGVRAMIEAMYVLFDRHPKLRSGGYENDFAQDDRLARDFDDVAHEKGYPLALSPDSNASASKDARIESLEPLASNMRLLWPSRAVTGINRQDVDRLKAQMLAWPSGPDDGPDALESAIARCRYRGQADGILYESLASRRYGRRRR